MSASTSKETKKDDFQFSLLHSAPKPYERSSSLNLPEDSNSTKLDTNVLVNKVRLKEQLKKEKEAADAAKIWLKKEEEMERLKIEKKLARENAKIEAVRRMYDHGENSLTAEERKDLEAGEKARIQKELEREKRAGLEARKILQNDLEYERDHPQSQHKQEQERGDGSSPNRFQGIRNKLRNTINQLKQMN